MLEPRIQQHFFESADLQYQAAELLSRPVADAAQAIVTSLTSGARLLVLGLGPAAPLAQLVVGYLNGRFERERPGLAAVSLGLECAVLTAAGDDANPGGLAARQLGILGQPGDLLLLLDADGDHPALNAAVRAAQAKELTVVALTGRSGQLLRELFSEGDVLVLVPHARRARVMETLLLILHSLCDVIDLQLLGEQEPA